MYVICLATSDAGEQAARDWLKKEIPFIAPHRCLFYESEIGKTAITRQVNPSLHIEWDRQFCEKLKPHLRKIVLYDKHMDRSNMTTQEQEVKESGRVENKILFVSTLQEIWDIGEKTA